MGEPGKTTARLRCGDREVFNLEISGGRENLQKLGQNINQFLTNIIEQKGNDGNVDGKDDENDDDDDDNDDSESSENNITPKRMKLL